MPTMSEALSASVPFMSRPYSTNEVTASWMRMPTMFSRTNMADSRATWLLPTRCR
jgi:hypothetical protein